MREGGWEFSDVVRGSECPRGWRAVSCRILLYAWIKPESGPDLVWLSAGRFPAQEANHLVQGPI